MSDRGFEYFQDGADNIDWQVLTESLATNEETPREIPQFSLSLTAYLEKHSEDAPVLPDAPHKPVERILSFLLSLLLNIALLILLALLLLPSNPEPPRVDAVFSDRVGEQLDMMTLDEGNLNPVQAPEYKFEIPQEARIEDINVYELEERETERNATAPLFDQSRIDIRDLLAGRTDPGLKNDLIAKYGGTEKTREAVRNGLLWLKKQQLRDGSWSLKGPYRDGLGNVFPENAEAATGLALLAFQGDGNTRYGGDFKESVQKGWKWLLKQQNEDGSFFKGARQEGGSSSGGRFYTQAICTIGLCELIVMEKGEGHGKDLRAVAQKGVDYLVQWQNPELGGWRYEEGVGSDLSVTGWVMIALQTARAAELYVPPETFDRVGVFLDSVAYDNGVQYCYSPELPEKRPSMTATGLLCREFLGWDRQNGALLEGADLLTQPELLVRYEPYKGSGAMGKKLDANGEKTFAPFSTNVYGWYSTSMMLKHLGPYNQYWRKWNQAMSQEIPAHQAGEDEAEAGSWDPALDQYRFGGGRLYVTVLSILCMEVYYRHLAIYQE